MAKINIEEEYNNDIPTEEPTLGEPASEDIEVTSEQLTIMKQLATEGRFEELGRLTAGLINGGAAAPAEPMV